MRINAVIAHFDPYSEKSANWHNLLRTLRPVVSDAVVVSTGISDRDSDFAKQLGYAVIQRGNVGYDFMSYSVGFDAIQGAGPASKILFCNDSFFISNESKFTNALDLLFKSNDPAVFLTSSLQITEHGQSYLFAVDRSVFSRRPFQQFMSSVRPQPTRLDVIYAYEIGLSSCLKDMGADFSSIMDSNTSRLQRRVIPKRGINPTHDYADEVELRYGIVKYERLIKNPLSLSDSARLKEIAQLAVTQQPVPAIKQETIKPPLIVICHCHYEEVVDELILILDRLPDGSQVHVTSSSPSVLASFKSGWRRSKVSLDVLATENKGRDVLPFLKVLALLKLPDNIPILKIHGKRSLYSPTGEKWRRDLLNELIPSEAGVQKIVNEFGNSPKLAMIGASGSYVSDLRYWGSNQARVFKFMTSAGSNPPASDDLGFYAGTMFWIRSQCANEILSNVDLDQFETEDGQRDGTYGHVLERAIPMTLRSQGWSLREIGEDTELFPHKVRHRKLTYF
ncbi:rhamnan synthesis F family protein [Phyllobacterium sp. UNC302MFCol5.2]|uniref:rhamnan synthesis F family protein n=1 Tax=Phyllobacterium sp. UNC302MFCol5.2 TaxID=1449065 RepID=UPI0004871DA8|nr:rhamnan synthesis F family protein [Phyllobacterium sp. UNC302MFCol5.2]